MIIIFHAEILSSPSSKKRKGMKWSEAPMSGNYTRDRCSQNRNSDDKNTHLVESGHMAVLHKLQITIRKNIWQVPLHWTGGLRLVRRGREWLMHHSTLKWPSVQWDVQGGYSHKLKEELLLEWVAMPFSSRPSWPRDQIHVSYVSCMTVRFFTASVTWEAMAPCRFVKELHFTTGVFGAFSVKNTTDQLEQDLMGERPHMDSLTNRWNKNISNST